MPLTKVLFVLIRIQIGHINITIQIPCVGDINSSGLKTLAAFSSSMRYLLLRWTTGPCVSGTPHVNFNPEKVSLGTSRISWDQTRV